MAKLQFESATAKGMAEHLMFETDAENRHAPHQIAHRLVRVAEDGRIARSVGKKDTVRLETERLLGRRGRRHHRHIETILAQTTQNVFLDSVVVGNYAMPYWRQDC